MGKAKIYGMKRKCIPNKKPAGMTYVATPKRSGKMERAMQLAVLHSYMNQKPIAVFKQETAERLLKTAKRLKMSIPFPVVIKLEDRNTNFEYVFFDESREE